MSDRSRMGMDGQPMGGLGGWRLSAAKPQESNNGRTTAICPGHHLTPAPLVLPQNLISSESHTPS